MKFLTEAHRKEDSEFPVCRPRTGPHLVFHQPIKDGLRETRADPRNYSEGAGGLLADTGNGAEALQQGELAGFRYTGYVVENTLFDPSLHQKLVIAIGPAVGFIPDPLEEP